VVCSDQSSRKWEVARKLPFDAALHDLFLVFPYLFSTGDAPPASGSGDLSLCYDVRCRRRQMNVAHYPREPVPAHGSQSALWVCQGNTTPSGEKSAGAPSTCHV
ncbi:hypothetical protein, partial [Mesorhizobium sp. LjRoot246]|uniref:hypothetical protein n=1 Tax=Mesorhizobium sp. LjRoot246 TaxID=3342294 RepID=UPI003F4F70A4